MGMARGLTAAAALLAAGAAQAQASQEAARAAFERDFCPDLKRLVRVSPDFVDMNKAHPALPLLGFRPGACRAFAGSATLPPAYWCHQHLAPNHLSLESLAAATAACLPEAERTRGRWSREATFTLPGARVLITERGGPGAKVGRIVGLRVEAIPPKKALGTGASFRLIVARYGPLSQTKKVKTGTCGDRRTVSPSGKCPR